MVLEILKDNITIKDIRRRTEVKNVVGTLQNKNGPGPLFTKKILNGLNTYKNGGLD